MKPEVTLKYLSYIRNKKANNEGFTLIELLVVVIIIGVLAAVALPNLLNQVGKARETEIKNAVGTINRSQQAYHFEKQAFASDQSTMGVAVPTTYIDDVDGAITANGAADANFLPKNAQADADGTRAYGGEIVFSQGEYSQIMCQTVATATVASAPDATAGTCGGTDTIVK
ncbi:prepilin-type N-terminal cleavage/methylation domain-containing protein [Cyanobacterium aponinum FACHB-4101]|uniref:type IV pilin protein n=1 Tax=Cyanobacterium aponinum TaxID=379064 RepID=UPI001680BD5C|nr:type IV pilin-like G/H family protein [Cyanobacterium aponinum]MBD2395649.1 prepilin-type N-terminal cleavage/methylation domain-containing protein [Cyanobacterium aponinum FACHB-4101]